MRDDEIWTRFAVACVTAALPMIQPSDSQPSDAVIASACSTVADAMLAEYKKRFK